MPHIPRMQSSINLMGENIEPAKKAFDTLAEWGYLDLNKQEVSKAGDALMLLEKFFTGERPLTYLDADLPYFLDWLQKLPITNEMLRAAGPMANTAAPPLPPGMEASVLMPKEFQISSLIALPDEIQGYLLGLKTESEEEWRAINGGFGAEMTLGMYLEDKAMGRTDFPDDTGVRSKEADDRIIAFFTKTGQRLEDIMNHFIGVGKVNVGKDELAKRFTDVDRSMELFLKEMQEEHQLTPENCYPCKKLMRAREELADYIEFSGRGVSLQ